MEIRPITTTTTRKARAALTAFAVVVAAGLGAAGSATADGVDPAPEIDAPPLDRFQVDPCADAGGLAASGVPPELLELLCPSDELDSSNPATGASRPGGGSWTSDDEAGITDSMCADVEVQTNLDGKQEHVVNDPLWAGSVGEMITEWIDNGFDGEEDSKATQTARAIVSPVAWLILIPAYYAEAAYDVATNPMTAHPITNHMSERIAENEDDADVDEDDRDGNDGDAGSSNDGDGSGGETESSPGPDRVNPGSSENGIEEHCQDKADRDRQDPHGHDRTTYIDTNCDDPTVNPNPAQGQTEIQAGEVENEVDCHDEHSGQPEPAEPSNHCGPTAQPVAGQHGCGGAVTRTAPEAVDRVHELDVPIEVEVCDPAVCQPLDVLEPNAEPAP